MTSAAANETYRAVILIWSVGAIISTLELLSLRAHFAPGRLFAWTLVRRRLARGEHFRSLLDALLARGFTGLLVTRLVAVVALALAPKVSALLNVSFAVVLVTTLLLLLRFEWGKDGSDQMSTVVLIAIYIGFGPISDDFLQKASLAFISAQTCLAYGVAGVAKLVSPIWRSGSALALILDTSTYGSAGAAAALRQHDGVGRILTRSVVAAEVAFGLGLVFLLPAPLAWTLLAWGVAFHVATAVLMGLNTFLWAFVSTYPAIIYIHSLLWT